MTVGSFLLTHACLGPQIGTTKGTGGDLILIDEMAYVEPGFFMETCAPLLLMGDTTLLAVSTLTSEISFYTRLIRMVDKTTGLPVFNVMQIQLACEACKAAGKAVECVHMLHLVPRWQSKARHETLKIIMQDRPDLIESELAGMAFDSLKQCFRPNQLELMFSQKPPEHIIGEEIHVTIDPAAGGAFSDYCILSIVRQKGLVTVRARVLLLRRGVASGHYEGAAVRPDGARGLAKRGGRRVGWVPVQGAQQIRFCHAHLLCMRNLYTLPERDPSRLVRHGVACRRLGRRALQGVDAREVCVQRARLSGRAAHRRQRGLAVHGRVGALWGPARAAGCRVGIVPWVSRRATHVWVWEGRSAK